MTAPTIVKVERLLSQLEYLRGDALAYVERHADELAPVAGEHRLSALNLLHYLALRQHDLRELQTELTELGLSSLGRSESAILAALDACLDNLRSRAGVAAETSSEVGGAVTFAGGRAMLQRNTASLLGPLPPGRERRIMVTIPGSAASAPELVEDLLNAGMNVMRINTAHDDPDTWCVILDHLARARLRTGRGCLVQFDLAGPKLRTGVIAGDDHVLHWRPKRDARGRALRPARVHVVPAGADREGHAQIVDGGITLPVEPQLLVRARSGDTLELEDLRGRRPELLLVSEDGSGGFFAEGWHGTYVESACAVALYRAGRRIAHACLGELPCASRALEVHQGDRLVLTSGQDTQRPDGRGGDDLPREFARIPTSLGAALAEVRCGEQVWIDDGRLGCVVEQVRPHELLVRVTYAPPKGAKLRAEKGINLPDSTLELPSLTSADLGHLDFVVAHADLVAMSFVRAREDVELLMEELRRRGAGDLGLVLKIETRKAFENLPDLLLTGMRWPKLGIMVARGDLAIEIGFERLAEVQEEMLWLCEAAHVPMIWATEVLDTLAQRGRPTRAEVTDAAMSGRAECIMLNKGPYIVDAVRFLDDVSRRMTAHQEKKRSLLRKLAVSHVHPRAGSG